MLTMTQIENQNDSDKLYEAVKAKAEELTGQR